MRVIELKIANNELIPLSDMSHLIAGPTPYVGFRITQNDAAWDVVTNIALVFECDKKQTMVQINSTVTMMPEEVCNERYFKMRVIGLSGGPDPKTRLATSEIFVTQEEV